MNDYYDYLNGYSDMNYMTNPNSMIGDLNYQSLMPIQQNYKTNKINTNQNEQVLDSFEGICMVIYMILTRIINLKN